MPVDTKFRIKLLEPKKKLQVEKRRDKMRRIPVKPSTREVLHSFGQSMGKQEIVKKIPRVTNLVAWIEIAYFSVCSKTGTARWLDLWDCDHFDDFTDMQSSVSDCRAWFSHTGYTVWGSSQTASGRINCFFNADSEGNYVCNVRLASYPDTSTSTVECLIDDSSFGPLSFSGAIDQPHFSHLTRGGHHFRIRQMNGSFFFYSLVVYKLS